MEGTTCSACPWQDTSFCFFPAPCGACSKHQLCLTPHVAEMLAKNFVPILRGSEGCLGGCCLHLLLEGSRLHLLNDFGSARRNAPSADPVKEALHWIFFFFFFLPCTDSCGRYSTLLPNDAAWFEKCPIQVVLCT